MPVPWEYRGCCFSDFSTCLRCSEQPILVPILVNTYFNGEGLSIQVTLICAGLGTLFFHACSKLKVPAFLGSSFAFLGGFSTVANLDTGIFADMTMGEKLPYACGGIVVAGLLYLILALVIKLVGVKRVSTICRLL